MGTQYLKYEKGEIAYEEMGRGPLAICIPGMGDLRSEYRFLAPQLAKAGYHVISMDLRGHGESSVTWTDYTVAGIGDDAVALIRSLSDGPAFLIGTSMGSGAVVWAAAESPELVKGVVLISPFVRGAPNRAANLLYRVLFSRPWGPSLWQTYYNRLYPTQKPEDFREYLAALKANLSQAGRLESLQQMLLASKSASEQRLPGVKSPALVLMGSKDPDFKNPEAEAQWLASKLNGQYEMVAGAGHYPHAEMPQAAGPRIISFLSGIMKC